MDAKDEKTQWAQFIAAMCHNVCHQSYWPPSEPETALLATFLVADRETDRQTDRQTYRQTD